MFQVSDVCLFCFRVPIASDMSVCLSDLLIGTDLASFQHSTDLHRGQRKFEMARRLFVISGRRTGNERD